MLVINKHFSKSKIWRVKMPNEIFKPLCLTLKDNTTDNKQTENERQNAIASAKSKRAASQHSKPTQCSALAFAPTHTTITRL
jgi:hypothetical protein